MNEMLNRPGRGENQRMTALEFRRFHPNGRPAFELRVDAVGAVLLAVVVLIVAGSPWTLEAFTKLVLEVMRLL